MIGAIAGDIIGSVAEKRIYPPCAEKLSHFISPAISCINSIHITFVLRLGGIFMIISYYLHIIFILSSQISVIL